MANERFTLAVAVFLVMVRDDKVLLMRRQNTGWQDGNYDFVAGHIEGGESMTVALCREAQEEAGIHIAPADVTLVHVFHSLFRDGKEYLNVFFEARHWQGEPSIGEPEKCDDLRWFGLNELPANLTPSTKAGLEAYLAKRVYAEAGFTD